MSVTATEECGCGASIRVTTTLNIDAMRQLAAFREEHKHEEATDEES